MKKYIFLLLITLPQISSTQIKFQLTIGGNNGDYATSIIQTTDGGYAIAGYTSSFGAGNSDFYIAKLDGIGALQWTKTVGGNGNEEAYSIIQTADGGYAVAGYTDYYGAGGSDFFIVKLDGTGATQWSRTVGGTVNEYAYSIIQTTDGGYAVAGYTAPFGAGNTDSYIVKLDGTGTLQWTRIAGGTVDDFAYSIIQTTDGGYAIAGYTSSFGAGSRDSYILKLDGTGTLQWTRTVGGNGNEYGRSIVQTTDGGYVVAGYTDDLGAGDYDFYIVKLGGTGTLQWTRTIGGIERDLAYSIIQTTDGGFAVTGYTTTFGAGSGDLYIVKLGNTGTLQWSKTVGGTGSDPSYSIIQTTDGGYAVTGVTTSFGTGEYDFYIVKFDGSGNTCGSSTSPPSLVGSGGTVNSPTSTITIPTPTMTMPTPSTGTGGILTTICLVIGIQPISNEIPNSYEIYQNYPNPFNPNSKIKFQIAKVGKIFLSVYDILGRKVATLVNEELNPGIYEVDFVGSNFSSGIYFYKLETDGFSDTKKMVLLK